MNATRRYSFFGTIVMLAVLLLGCAPTSGRPVPSLAPQSAAPPAQSGPRKNSATLAVAAVIPALSWAYTGTSSGGAYSFAELYMQGLVTTSTNNTAPEPRIAAELPSIDRGTAQVAPDGKMRVTWKIRPEVKWADGQDLTARDYSFGYDVLKSKDNPLAGSTSVINISGELEGFEVVDDKTFVMMWARPFFQFDSLGYLAFQPLPTHVLRPLWDEKNLESFTNHAYWRNEYFQVGPYRVSRFEPQNEIVLTAVPTYFLGRPKLDTITIKQYTDANTLYAAVLARAVDVTADNAMSEDQAVELKNTWDRTGEGKVYIGYGTSRGIFPQFEPSYQTEPAMLEPRVRQALYRAVDRETWSATILAGYKENTAQHLLPPDHPLHEFTKDTLRQYRYDPQQALRELNAAGWTRGADGALTNAADGRRFRQEIWTTQDNENEAAILADMWKQIGLESVLTIVPNAQASDREYRQSYRGVEVSARGYGDQILTRAECSTAAVGPRFSGSNRGHYCNPQMDQLINSYRSSLTRADQGKWVGEIARAHAQDLPMMQLYYNLSTPAVIKGLNALSFDFGGGIQPGTYYGSYFRNAHLWEWS
jgi:peptide/nickel transport system substrate-binding protein